MAESAVYSALGKLADPVIRALINESFFLYGVRGDVDWLQRELQWMKCFLKDAEAKRRRGDELIKNWVREVREVAHQAEDIIDTFTIQIESKNIDEVCTNRGLLPCIEWVPAFCRNLISLHNFGTDIKGLRAQIENIKLSKERYGLVNLPETTTAATAADENLRRRRRIYSHENDTLVFGLDDHKNEIADRLLNPNIKRRTVVSIVGIGGLGKTTLANKVYHQIKAEFDAWACISVSEDYKVLEIFKGLAKQMMGKPIYELQSMDVDELGEMLREFLMQRRYLILLDDVWSEGVWGRLVREALPEANNGSRVLLTTRNMDVATSIDRTIPPYELPFLNEDESWALFLNKAFLPNESCSEELEGIGRRLVKRCGGLPLALEVLGGILSSKEPNSVTWTSLADHFDWSFIDIRRDCSKILGLSYDDLPHHHLKSCFLYLGVFPEDSEIEAQQLIELWVAEGFIPHELETHMIMEDTAHAYLEELADRSMIQVVEKDWLGSSASVSTLRIHDLFRDLCIREAIENDFFNIGTTTTLQDTINNHGKNLRRLVVHGDISSNTSADFMSPLNLKSILHFGTASSIIIPNGLKLLRVIHFVRNQNNVDEKFPEIFAKMIKNMRHLRYFRLSNSSFTKINFHLPCIRNLCNLQTLDLRRTNFSMVPDWLGEISTLRHLYLDSFSCLADVGSLTNLQTLVGIKASGGWMRGLEIPLIRTLTVSGLKVFPDSLQNMKYLSCLNVVNFGEVAIPIEILSGLSENAQLRSLKLWGLMSVRQLPKSLHGFPLNLTTLLLCESELHEDPMATLEKLPYLRVLLMTKSYIGKEMVCTSGGFPRLLLLELYELEELEEWRVEDGAMPSLTRLDIGRCKKLKRLPEGLQHLHSLQTFYLESTHLGDRVRPEVGQDWYKIKHVPQIALYPSLN